MWMCAVVAMNQSKYARLPNPSRTSSRSGQVNIEMPWQRERKEREREMMYQQPARWDVHSGSHTAALWWLASHNTTSRSTRSQQPLGMQ